MNRGKNRKNSNQGIKRFSDLRSSGKPDSYFNAAVKEKRKITYLSLSFFRLSEFSSKNEKKDRLKKSKPTELIQTSLADRFNQLQGAENAWRKKVSYYITSPSVQWGEVVTHVGGITGLQELLKIKAKSFTVVLVLMSRSRHMLRFPLSIVHREKTDFGSAHISSSAESARFPRCRCQEGVRFGGLGGCSRFGSGVAKASDPGLS